MSKDYKTLSVDILKEIIICSECQKEKKLLNIYSDLGKIILKCTNKDCENKSKEETVDLNEYIKDDILNDYNELEDDIKGEEDKTIIEENNIDNEPKDLISNNEKEKKKKEEEKKKEENIKCSNVLKEKKIKISNMIRALQLVLETQEKHPNNYYHILSLENLGKSYENNENREPKFIDKLDKELEKIEEKMGDQRKISYELWENYGVGIWDDILKEENLKLILIYKEDKKYKKLGEKIGDKNGLELISQLIFRNLIELIVPNNGIKDLKCLDTMLLPHLELIDVSNNNIDDITPIANIKSRYLSEIYLQNNKIKSLEPFLKDSICYKIRILRVENNNLNYKDDIFKRLKTRYNNIIIYKDSMDTAKFNINHNTTLKETNFSECTKIETSRVMKNKETLIHDLFLLIKRPNNIKYLNLDNNFIKDASLISSMHLPHLIELDLSVNEISNISFLKKLSKKSKKLKNLYLDRNKIIDISVLKCTQDNQNDKNDKDGKYKSNCIFHFLENLCIKNDSLNKQNIKDEEVKNMLKTFIEENIKTDVDFSTENDNNNNINNNNNNNNINNNDNNNNNPSNDMR